MINKFPIDEVASITLFTLASPYLITGLILAVFYNIISFCINSLSYALAVTIKCLAYVFIKFENIVRPDNVDSPFMKVVLTLVHSLYLICLIPVWSIIKTFEQLANLVKLPLFNTLVAYIVFFTGNGFNKEKNLIMKLRKHYNERVIDIGKYTFLKGFFYFDRRVFLLNQFSQKKLSELEVNTNLQTKHFEKRISILTTTLRDQVSKTLDFVRAIIEYPTYLNPLYLVKSISSLCVLLTSKLFNYYDNQENSFIYDCFLLLFIFLFFSAFVTSTLLFGINMQMIHSFFPTETNEVYANTCAFLLGLIEHGLIFLAFEPLKFLISQVSCLIFFVVETVLRPFVALFNIIFSNHNDYDSILEYEPPTTSIKNGIHMPASLFILEKRIQHASDSYSDKDFDNNYDDDDNNPLNEFKKIN